MTKIDPALPVKDLLAGNPEFRPVLAAYDIETCCGGEHPLADACRARGVTLEEVVRELGHAADAARTTGAPPAGDDLVVPATSIREILREFPSTAAVFEKHGLGDCGGESGPDEPLGWFATVHRIPLDPLLADVRAAARRDAIRRPAAARKAASLPFSPEFILGSLVLTLTLGATTGMINLLRIAAGGDVPFSHRQMHAHTQILGFAALRESASAREIRE